MFLKKPSQNHLILGVCIGTIFLAFGSLLFNSDFVLLRYGLLTNLWPQKLFWLETVREYGELPVWNHYSFAGVPYWPDPKTAVLYPLNLVLLLFSREHFFQGASWYLFIHHLIAFFGMRMFLLHKNIDVKLCSIFALVYALSGIGISTQSLANSLTVFMLLPWFFLCLENWLKKEEIISRDALGLISIYVLLCLGTAIEFAFLLSLFQLIRTLKNFSKPKILSLLFIGCFSLTISLSGLLPSIEFVLDSSRLASKSIVANSQHSFHPFRSLSFFFAFPFGDLSSMNSYWGGRIFHHPEGLPLYFSQFLGTASLFGVVMFLHAFWRSHIRWIAAVTLLFLISCGSSLPIDFFSLSERLFPIFRYFHHPEKFILFVSFATVIASARGWDHLQRHVSSKKQRWNSLFLLWCASILSVSALLVVVYPVIANAWPIVFPWFAFSIIAFTLLIVFTDKPQINRRIGVILLLLVVPEMLSHANRLLLPQPKALLDTRISEMITADMYRRREDFENGHAFRYFPGGLQSLPFETSPMLEKHFDSVGVHAFNLLSRIAPNVNVLYGISSIQSGGALVDHEQSKFFGSLFSISPGAAIDLLSVKYVGAILPGETVPKFASIRESSLPYVKLASTIRAVQSPEEYLHRLGKTQIDYKSELAVEGARGLFSNLDGEISELDRRNGRISFKILGKSGEGYTLINESWNKYWRAEVDGRRSKVFRGNGWAMALYVPKDCPNICEVQLFYDNPLIQIGFWLGLVAFLLLSLLSILVWRGYLPKK